MTSPTFETCAKHIRLSATYINERPTFAGGALWLFKSVLGYKLSDVNKVDVMAARRKLHRNVGWHPAGGVTHAPYRREPYVRAQLDDGRTVDAKVSAWTPTQVLLHWIDEDGKAWNVWTLATRVQRITAEESAWRDPYDLEWQNRAPKK